MLLLWRANAGCFGGCHNGGAMKLVVHNDPDYSDMVREYVHNLVVQIGLLDHIQELFPDAVEKEINNLLHGYRMYNNMIEHILEGIKHDKGDHIH